MTCAGGPRPSSRGGPKPELMRVLTSAFGANSPNQFAGTSIQLDDGNSAVEWMTEELANPTSHADGTGCPYGAAPSTRACARIYGGKVMCQAGHVCSTFGALLARTHIRGFRVCTYVHRVDGPLDKTESEQEVHRQRWQTVRASWGLRTGRAPGRTKAKPGGMERKTIRKSCATASMSVHNGQ
ncbi:hypothetical protein B0H13DRAFT_2278240 [Mycena leptocephala]|nr:hypothetical protein B0H13DRAFT_2278240 [Mycena leptocephala]